MKFLLNFFISFLIVSLCFSCSQKPAQIVNRGKNIYNKNRELSKNKSFGEEKKSSVKIADNQIKVGAGETLYSLAKKHQVSVRDLVAQNDLTSPYILKKGTVLNVPTPNYHEVKAGETLYAISRSYNMKIDDLIAINDLKKPYSVKVGEKIKIAKLEEKKVPVVSEQVQKKPEKIAEKKSEKNDEPTPTETVFNKSNKFSWPIRGAIVSKFGPKSGGLYNDGINIKAKEGADVKAAESGVAAYVGNELKGYGNLVIIKHSGGWITAYAHLSKMSVARGQKVAKGEKIGLVGSSGNVTSPQLYFGLRKGRDAVNPENYLK